MKIFFQMFFLKVFQIKEVILGIKEALSVLKIRHLYILLDDFSEIDDTSINTFVDVVLAPLNNWSDEFIKFKVAKIEIINISPLPRISCLRKHR